MAVFKTLAFLLFVFLTFFQIHETIASDRNSSFSFNGFSKSSSFEENIALFRDSKLVNGGSSIQLTNSVSQSEGRVLYKKPINLFQEGKERNFSGSFSSHFSISSNSGLSFVMVPSGLDLSSFHNTSSGLGFLSKHKIVAIEFGLRNSVRILVSNYRTESAKIRNLSSFGDDDETYHHFKRLNCWIDYESSSKRIEIRLSVSNAVKPVDPFVSYSLDLAKFWKNGKFLVGLVSVNGKSSKPRYLYEWSFEMRYPSMSKIHSQPLDPNVKEEEKPVEVKEGRGKKCIWRMLSALVLGAVCGTFGAVFALYVWTICGNRKSVAVVPEECANEKSDNVVVIKEDVDEEAKK